MGNRFSGLFNLTEEQAIEILDGPAADSDEASSRYIAASHLVNFDTDAAIAALLRAVNNTDADLDNRIVRRKAVESLGRLKVKAALPTLSACLDDEDAQLERPDQSYRTIIHTQANLGYKPAGDRIASFTTSDKAPIASAALSAMYRLNGDESAIPKVMG